MNSLVRGAGEAEKWRLVNHMVTSCRWLPSSGRAAAYNSCGALFMSTKRSSVAALQRELLIAAVKDHNSRLKFARGSAETLATTYAALLSLQRKKLIEPEKPADPALLSWKVTKAGKAAITEKPGRR